MNVKTLKWYTKPIWSSTLMLFMWSGRPSARSPTYLHSNPTTDIHIQILNYFVNPYLLFTSWCKYRAWLVEWSVMFMLPKTVVGTTPSTSTTMIMWYTRIIPTETGEAPAESASAVGNSLFLLSVANRRRNSYNCQPHLINSRSYCSARECLGFRPAFGKLLIRLLEK